VNYHFEDLLDTEHVELHTASGSVHLERIMCNGNVIATTRSGTITLEQVIAAKSVEARSTSDSITLEHVDAMGGLKVTSVSGSIHVRGDSTANAADLSTVSGEIDAHLLLTQSQAVESSVVVVRSVSGSISLTLPMEPEIASVAKITGKSVSGSVDMKLDAEWAGKFSLSTWTGSVNLVDNGDIVYDEDTPKRKVGHKLDDGQGDGVLEVNTVSGNVDVQFN
jgi:DUF4097 and DUF4098 domain-containing protein YvlB